MRLIKRLRWWPKKRRGGSRGFKKELSSFQNYHLNEVASNHQSRCHNFIHELSFLWLPSQVSTGPRFRSSRRKALNFPPISAISSWEMVRWIQFHFSSMSFYVWISGNRENEFHWSQTGIGGLAIFFSRPQTISSCIAQISKLVRERLKLLPNEGEIAIPG